jgi:hypothetical protein
MHEGMMMAKPERRPFEIDRLGRGGNIKPGLKGI